MLVQFNPESLFDLIRQQCNEPNKVIQKVTECNTGFWESKYSFHCVNNSTSDEEIGIADTILLSGHPKGIVAIDFCKNGNVAGYEYIDLT